MFSRALSLLRPSLVVALLIAGFVQVSSMLAAKYIINVEPMYAYYVVIFLICFAWYMATIATHLISSQLVSGLATVFLSISVVDCYYANGYETFLSLAFPYIMVCINILTILAAYCDRDRFTSYPIGRIGRSLSVKKANGVNKCH